MPNLPCLARFLAARSQFELVHLGATNAASARSACLANIRQAAISDEIGASECRAYFELAFELEDFDLARALLNQWERRQPGEERLLRSRIQLELAAGAFGTALKLSDRMLASHPNDSWVLAQRNAALEKLEGLLRSSTQVRPVKP
jgi:predicted Zn-dependent protease